jgi:hypothetical protein
MPIIPLHLHGAHCILDPRGVRRDDNGLLDPCLHLHLQSVQRGHSSPTGLLVLWVQEVKAQMERVGLCVLRWTHQGFHLLRFESLNEIRQPSHLEEYDANLCSGLNRRHRSTDLVAGVLAWY